MPSKQLIAKIQDTLVTAGDDQLYVSLAGDLPSAVAGEIGGGASLKLGNPLEFGKKFYNSVIRPKLKEAICVKAGYCKNVKKYKGLGKATGLVAGASAEYVVTALGLPPGSGKGALLVISISTLVLKEGLNKLCECS